MTGFLCCLWWFLLGLLLGWLLSWLFDKFFRRGGDSGGATNYRAAAPATPPAPAPASANSLATATTAASAAAAFGFSKLKSADGYDNFEIIEGIGPKINGLLHAAGVHTFSQLAAMEVPAIGKILDAAGPNFKLANPESWAQQAALCASASWETLKKLQDELVAGVSMKNDET
jgi:predicted flap endonuclease-1-like 5' DNA nuclease